jgi:phosphatidylserine/phosphatidylglycerophosphate/cardiolipin synthase-like enzyme
VEKSVEDGILLIRGFLSEGMGNLIHRSWAERAEYASIFATAIGSVAGVAFQQAAFVAAPLSVSLLLNLANRSQLEQQTRQTSAIAITEVEQKLSSLQQQVQTISYPSSAPSLDFSHIEKILDELVAEVNTIPGQIEEALESRATQILHQLQAKSQLINGPNESREKLELALSTAQTQLIIVSPWLRTPVFEELLPAFEAALKRGVHIKIGWGYQGDVGKIITLGQNGWIYHKNQDKQDSYSALPRFQALQQKYPRQCTLKLLGTHEKFLACDRTFAVLGSHNFLSAGPDGKQREIGIFTTDPYIIQELIDCFDKGSEVELSRAA